MNKTGFKKCFQVIVIATCFATAALLYPVLGAEIIAEGSARSGLDTYPELPRKPINNNLPETGYSLFDQIFSQQTSTGFEYDVPYPFEKILDRISGRQPGSTEFDQEKIVAVLVPKGRSLQRDAARPDFFRYPRLLLTVDSESAHRSLTRDRLFLGYQEKAEIIEVISYNESLGRFEFQTVKNYAKNKKPLVQYANRVLCTSCHQNAAPIFPRSDWSETNHDILIARRIGEYHSRYHGVPTGRPFGMAGRFDSATDRASLFSVYQQLWQQGCGIDADGGRSCRASVFLAMLYYRLASLPRPLFDSPLIRDHLLPVLGANWNRLWPGGLPVPVADLPNRTPNLDTLDTKLTPNLDPLSLRPPQHYWTYQRAAELALRGLSKEFLLDSDIQLLNDYLYQLASNDKISTQHYRGNCSFEFQTGNKNKSWLPLECTINKNRDEIFLNISGELLIRSRGQLDQNLSWLYVNESKQSIRASVSGRIGPLKFPTTARGLQLFKPFERLHSRLRDNRLITQLTFNFDWQPASGDNNRPENIKFNGGVSLQLANDFSIIEQAVVDLLEDAASGKFAGFDDSPIQGVAIMDALFQKIGIEFPISSGLTTPAGLILRPDSDSTEISRNFSYRQTIASAFGSPFQVFLHYCVTCHGGNTRLPPGFLAGPPAKIKNQLARCAPRIGRRLGIWELDEDNRPTSPMPPLTYLQSRSIDPDWWRDSRDLRLLRDYVVSLGSELHTGVAYENLPSCLPE
jgi:hypothetical protein